MPDEPTARCDACGEIDAKLQAYLDQAAMRGGLSRGRPPVLPDVRPSQYCVKCRFTNDTLIRQVRGLPQDVGSGSVRPVQPVQPAAAAAAGGGGGADSPALTVLSGAAASAASTAAAAASSASWSDV